MKINKNIHRMLTLRQNQKTINLKTNNIFLDYTKMMPRSLDYTKMMTLMQSAWQKVWTQLLTHQPTTLTLQILISQNRKLPASTTSPTPSPHRP